jgi:hypothetical protein
MRVNVVKVINRCPKWWTGSSVRSNKFFWSSFNTLESHLLIWYSKFHWIFCFGVPAWCFRPIYNVVRRRQNIYVIWISLSPACNSFKSRRNPVFFEFTVLKQRKSALAVMELFGRQYFVGIINNRIVHFLRRVQSGLGSWIFWKTKIDLGTEKCGEVDSKRKKMINYYLFANLPGIILLEGEMGTTTVDGFHCKISVAESLFAGWVLSLIVFDSGSFTGSCNSGSITRFEFAWVLLK